VRGSPCVRCKRATKNPVLRTGLVNVDAGTSAVSVPACGAGLLIGSLEALVHLLMLVHAGCYPSLDVVGPFHFLLIGVDQDRHLLKCEAPAFARGFHGDRCYRSIMKARASGRGRAVRCFWCAASAFRIPRRGVRMPRLPGPQKKFTDPTSSAAKPHRPFPPSSTVSHKEGCSWVRPRGCRSRATSIRSRTANQAPRSPTG
jgi:hypothetical protein